MAQEGYMHNIQLFVNYCVRLGSEPHYLNTKSNRSIRVLCYSVCFVGVSSEFKILEKSVQTIEYLLNTFAPIMRLSQWESKLL